ncbi:MAG TPA: Xaa-Pro peptidase family protein [Candidatus Acidoferrales bacterium]|nr:Xaa-Pro peptidase family protein [Candidatus Acidoferrales bacterium]
MNPSSAKSKPEISARSRIHRLRLSFFGLRHDALLISHLPDIRYLCGFSGSAGFLLIEPDRATLFTDSRYTFQARDEVSGATIRIAKRGLLREAGESLRVSRRKRLTVGFSPAYLTVSQKQALESAAGPRVRWSPSGNEVERLRAIKDASELRLMKQAAAIISGVFESLLPKIKPGMAELDLAAEAEFAMRRMGAEGPSFETIVAAGPRSAWAHARPTSKLLRKNELVVLDQGAILRGYCSDMTRTVFLGRSSRRVRQLYGAVLEAQQAAKAAIRPGVEAGQVDAAARRVFAGYKLDRFFTHSTGHGLGIEVHEPPRIGRGDTTLLQPGMVVTVEPGLYVEGFGGIRIEDDVLVTANGVMDLTTSSRELFEL